MAETFSYLPLLGKEWLRGFESHLVGHLAGLLTAFVVASLVFVWRQDRAELAIARRAALLAFVCVALLDAVVMLLPAAAALHKQQLGKIAALEHELSVREARRPELSLYQSEPSTPDTRDFSYVIRDTSLPIFRVTNTGTAEAFDVIVEIQIPTNIYHHVNRVTTKPRASISPAQTVTFTSKDLIYWVGEKRLEVEQSFLFFLTQARLTAPLQIHRRDGLKYPGDDGRLFTRLSVFARYRDRSNRQFSSEFLWQWYPGEREYRLSFESDTVEARRRP